MPGLPEVLRAAGNVFLRPVELSDLPDAQRWRRALLVGSGNERVVGAASQALRRLNPRLEIHAPGIAADRPVSTRGYDMVCLLQTGEGGEWEKIRALLGCPRAAMAYGRGGQWYRVDLPTVRLLSGRWWARATLAWMVSAGYLLALAALRLSDGLWRLAPLPPPIRDPGPAEGRRVTFIVPTHNQRQLMDFCLPPLLAEAGRRHQVLVVDDASTDGTDAHLRRHYPQVRVLRLARNVGFARAVRAGIAVCDTPFFALINTDVQVRPGLLAAILPHFDREDTFAVCARIELPGGSPMETGRVAPAFSGILEPYHVAPERSGPILYAGGASSVYHRARYLALGGFETLFQPLYWEDIELGYRAWRVGWRSLFEPAASVLHQRRAWIGRRFGDAFANETFLKNALLFIWKDLRDPELLAQHAAYICARLWRELTRGEGMTLRAVLRALPSLPAALARRWRERRRGDLSDRDILALADPLAAPREDAR